MQKDRKYLAVVTSRLLDKALSEGGKAEMPINVQEDAFREVEKAKVESEDPICMIEEITGRYHVIFPSGREQIYRSKGLAIDVLRGYGVKNPNFTPFREIYDPASPNKPLKGGDGLIMNCYEKSSYQKVLKKKGENSSWPTIKHLLENVIPDQRVRDAFLNWFAVIFNTGKKTETAWVLLGSQGSGKTMLVTKILFPMLGLPNCVLLNQDALTSRYNELMNRKQFVCFNEVHSSTQAAERIKTWITEDDIRLEDKSASAHVEENHLNLIFTSNAKVPVQIENDDRRFSVIRTGGPLAELRWFRGATTVRTIKRELSSFAAYLHSYPYSESGARKPTVTAEKQRMIEASLDPYDRLVDLLRRKGGADIRKAIGSDNLTKDELSELSKLDGGMTKDLLRKLAEVILGESISKTKLTQELRHRGIGEVRGAMVNGKRKRTYVWGEVENRDKSDT